MQLNHTQHSNLTPHYWARHENNQPVTQGALTINPAANHATIGSSQIFLRPIEFRLLHFFMTHPDLVHSRERLLDEIWDSWGIVEKRTVDVHIRRLRIKLQPFGLDTRVKTIHCRGYLFSSTTSNTHPAVSIN